MCEMDEGRGRGGLIGRNGGGESRSGVMKWMVGVESRG